MIQVPIGVVVTQWVLLGAFATLLLIFYRQLAADIRLTRETRGILAGLPRGADAPEFSYVDARSGRDQRFVPGSRWYIVMFADPLCLHCETAMIALAKVMTHRQDLGVVALVITLAEANAVKSAPAFRDTTLDVGIVTEDVSRGLWSVDRAPFFHVVDPNGRIYQRGPTDSTDEIAALLPTVVGRVGKYPVGVMEE